MSQWKNIGPIVALSITAALAGTGCLAESADDESITDDTADVVVEEQSAVAANPEEKTGEAEQAWFGGFGGFGGCGLGFGGCGFGFPFAGCGGFGGCGIGFGGCGFGGFGGCGFGGCGFGGCGFGGCW